MKRIAFLVVFGTLSAFTYMTTAFAEDLASIAGRYEVISCTERSEKGVKLADICESDVVYVGSVPRTANPGVYFESGGSGLWGIYCRGRIDSESCERVDEKRFRLLSRIDIVTSTPSTPFSQVHTALSIEFQEKDVLKLTFSQNVFPSFTFRIDSF
ncbi:MAG: hypothetical protein HC902_13230 [Calothrix sp. SM1_5_4]|nr:hypothetical protein [Calothrix sp. SM1_5_4]